jgi:D-amino-acid dehydrogenase
MKRVVIIGGGIVGQFIAYYLSKKGHDITVVDDQPEMSPASAGNCGLITPSHILPMNSWGTLIQGLKWLGKKDAPLSIRPQLEGPFLSWFASFMWHCNKQSVSRATSVRHQFLQESWSLYEQFFQEEKTASEWSKGGLVYACKSEKGLKSLKHEYDALQANNLASSMLTRNELLEMEPHVKEDTIGGAIFECDGWLKPGQLLLDIREINIQNRVKFIKGRVASLNEVNGTIKGAFIDGQEVVGDQYILAAGAQSVHLARPLGIDLKMIPGKGYNLTVNMPQTNQPKHPIYMVERKVVATPWATGFRLGSTMEFTGFDLSLNPRRLEALKRAASEYLRMDISDIEFTPWAGWRPMTSDSCPVVKSADKHKNLILATGHGMLGLSMAPATGKRVEKLLEA